MDKEQAAEAYQKYCNNSFTTFPVSEGEHFKRGWEGCEAQQLKAAGPVWVKVAERLPTPDDKYHAVRDKNGRYYSGYASSGMFQIMGVFCSPNEYHQYEWLDESGQQAFTREQMKEAFHKGIAFCSSPRGYPDFETFMNTNFPPSK